ncbi:MAG: HpcH/HpaI aldolase family protein [Burkholderiales bacterium]
MNTLKQRLRDGKRVVGCIQMTRSADVTEVLAGTGLDFLMIDHEHGLGSMGDLVDQLRAMRATQASALVRVPSADAAYVHRLLDAGVTNILFPAVESADAARAAVRSCRYPPAGDRGAGGSLRATDFDRDPGYYTRANDEILVGVQIESSRGVDAAAEITAVEGVDLVVIGPRDLSASIGKLNQFGDPAVQTLFERSEKAVLASGVAMGTVIYPGLTLKDMFARGHRLMLVGTDVSYLARSARAMVEAAA